MLTKDDKIRVIQTYMENRGMPLDSVNLDEMSPEKLEFNYQIFARATGGDAKNAEFQFGKAQKSPPVWRELGLEGSTILDAGCGTGYQLHFLEGAGYKPFGINICEVEAELAAHGKPDESMVMRWDSSVNHPVEVSEIKDMSYESDFFDAVGCYGVLMTLPHTERILHRNSMTPLQVSRAAMDEFRRVLKQDGYLRLITLGREKGPSGRRTEDYIAFDGNGYCVYDIHGEIVEEGNISIKELFTRSGFNIVNEPEKTESGYWKVLGQKV